MLALVAFLRCFLASRSRLQLENLALRHQLTVYQRSVKRPKLRDRDRILWSVFSRVLTGWRELAFIAKPHTVVEWRRRRFRDYWRRLSRRSAPGRPTLSPVIQAVIRQMSSANVLWGAPRIVGELAKLGIEVAGSTVAKYMVKKKGPASPTWTAFLRAHLREMVSVDFFVVPTIRNQVLYVFLVLSHERRCVFHGSRTGIPAEGGHLVQRITDGVSTPSRPPDPPPGPPHLSTGSPVPPENSCTMPWLKIADLRGMLRG